MPRQTTEKRHGSARSPSRFPLRFPLRSGRGEQSLPPPFTAELSDGAGPSWGRLPVAPFVAHYPGHHSRAETVRDCPAPPRSPVARPSTRWPRSLSVPRQGRGPLLLGTHSHSCPSKGCGPGSTPHVTTTAAGQELPALVALVDSRSHAASRHPAGPKTPAGVEAIGGGSPLSYFRTGLGPVISAGRRHKLPLTVLASGSSPCGARSIDRPRTCVATSLLGLTGKGSLPSLRFSSSRPGPFSPAPASVTTRHGLSPVPWLHGPAHVEGGR